MSQDYAESRIAEALRQHKGNVTKTRAQVLAWAGEDQRLLFGLARPHLTGIIAYAVSRVINKAGAESDEAVPEDAQGLDMAPDTFGKEILKALSSQNTPIFGHEAGSPGTGRKQASQSHIDAMKKLTSKNPRRR